MLRARVFGVALLAAFVAVGVFGQDPGQDPSVPVPAPGGLYATLGYGFGVQIDQPFQAVGSEAMATLFFFNKSEQDAWGFGLPFGGEGCSFFVDVHDDKGRLVRRPRIPCPLAGAPGLAPIGPWPLLSGSFYRHQVPVLLEYAWSETGDPNEELLPGGLYTLRARHIFDGPRPEMPPFLGAGADPTATVPFRIYRCASRSGDLPFRELERGWMSGYGYGEPDFYGEDLVLRTAGAAQLFWEKHTSGTFPPPPPQPIDFASEMVIATVLGTRPNGSYSAEVVRVTEESCHIEVTVVEMWSHDPSPAVITNPYHLVAVPRSMKEVIFMHVAAIPAGEEGGDDGNAP